MATDDEIDVAGLSRRLDDAVEGLDIYRPDQSIPPPTAEEREAGVRRPVRIHELRRAGRPDVEDNIDTVSLVEDDGVLRWQPGLGFGRRARGRRGRRRRRGAAARGTIVKQFKFRSLEKSRVGEALEKLDAKLTPRRGLRRWSSLSRSTGVERPARDGRVLLFVHGTFSNTENLFEGLRANPDGPAFFDAAKAYYDQILSFDHPTVSVNPFLNAVELARRFEGSQATVDVVCHSRGGLVTRWWAEELVEPPTVPGRLILVGSPLAGTSLAAAPRLRASLDYLTNLGNVFGTAAGMASASFPFLTAVTGIVRVVTSATRFASRVPIFDAAIAMIPGLSAQARTGDNPSIQSLRRGISRGTAPDYYVIQSDFEPPPVGWKFWRAFQNPGKRIANFGADLVFDEPNDLVVNTTSMNDLADGLKITDPGHVHDFGQTHAIHHTNYFEQAETVERFRRWLRIP
jgi:hypothetical protein